MDQKTDQKMQRQVPWSPPDMGESEKKAAIEVINSGWITQGKITEALEKELAGKIGCKHCVVVNNGTSALITALLAHGIGPGDEVIVPALTFIATINSVIAVGAKPVLADSDIETFNTTPEIVKQRITEKTKAIMPVDVAGMPVDIDGFKKLAEENNLVLIEDAAEAIGAGYKGRNIGSFGHTSIFSFHMAKLCAGGEGGCISTDDDAFAEKCRMICNHGMKGRYEYLSFGLNFRITDIQSAIIREQLKKLDHYVKSRNGFADIYKKNLKNAVFQKIPSYVDAHPWMIFGVLVDKDKRDAIIKKLNENGIGTRICWPAPHKQGYHTGLFSGSYPNCEEISSRIINLPMGNALTVADIEYVCRIFNEANR